MRSAARGLIRNRSASSSWLVAWLRLRPELHLRLWAAESWRRQIEDVLPVFEGREPPREVTARMRAALELKRQIVAEAKALAIAEHVVSARSRSLIPSVKARADAVGTPGASQAYEILFGPWSEWTHTGSGSLPVEIYGAKVRFDKSAPEEPVQIRAMASALYAYQLAELSRWLGLGIEEVCDRLRQTLVSSEQQYAQDRRATSDHGSASGGSE